MRRYRHGDIVGIADSPLRHIARRVFKPHTDLYHWCLVCGYVEHEDDYIILESIARGICVGRLSWYQGREYRVFRVTMGQDRRLGRRVCQELTRFGRARYDWLFLAVLPFDCLRCWLRQLFTEGRFRAIQAAELKHWENERLTCTEAANAWRYVGYPIVPPGVKPMPSAFIEAVNVGRLIEVT